MRSAHDEHFENVFARQERERFGRQAPRVLGDDPVATVDVPVLTDVVVRSGGKFGNEKTGGYASKREARRAQQLKLLEKAGEITELVEQPKFLLIPKQDGERACHYVGDFAYVRNGEYVVEDAKGYRTREYVIKRKLMLFAHRIKVREV